MDSIHDESYKGFTIKIYPDDSAENPRQMFDHLGTITMCNIPHRSIDLTEKHAVTLEEPRGTVSDLKPGYFQYRCLRFFNDVALALPLWYSSRGIAADDYPLSSKDNDDPAGFIYVTKTKMREEYGNLAETPEALDQARICLVGEIEELAAYLSGECYGYQITREDIDEGDPIIDSCWGYYGLDDAISAARSMIDDLTTPLAAVA